MTVLAIIFKQPNAGGEGKFPRRKRFNLLMVDAIVDVVVYVELHVVKPSLDFSPGCHHSLRHRYDLSGTARRLLVPFGNAMWL